MAGSVKPLALLGLCLGVGSGAGFSPEIGNAFEQYVGSVRARTEAGANQRDCFLTVDESPPKRMRVKRGEIVVWAAAGSPRRVPGGLIHHWEGAVFIPGATLAQALETVRDYGHYKDFYPNVVSSSNIRREGPVDHFRTIERHQAMFSQIALDADFTARYTVAGEHEAYTFAETTRMQQVDDYGQTDQRELEPNAPKAYVWRLSTVSRFEQRDGGVYMELEGMALSRDIPAAFRWIVDPFVRSAAKSAMSAMLRATRHAVQAGGSKMPASVTFRGE